MFSLHIVLALLCLNFASSLTVYHNEKEISQVKFASGYNKMAVVEHLLNQTRTKSDEYNCNSDEEWHSNPSNCKTFFLCHQCRCSELICPDQLLFNNQTKQCDWPESANCCEFWERDPKTLVADGSFM
ncbi:hypothetical protein ILUMI_05042 [Ignelater luminosus]|uniref:Chitin-binding type-2 domain-containing protein n=1 Tax=Ignelater luminosus TaxID=2038154 RepID=A0A8K0D7V0_IGNLU|nr:hypothetical protein ILUMI_05042 [Ignelater luminosus]